jgi:hypothetical protein
VQFIEKLRNPLRFFRKMDFEKEFWCKKITFFKITRLHFDKLNGTRHDKFWINIEILRLRLHRNALNDNKFKKQDAETSSA